MVTGGVRLSEQCTPMFTRIRYRRAVYSRQVVNIRQAPYESSRIDLTKWLERVNKGLSKIPIESHTRLVVLSNFLFSFDGKGIELESEEEQDFPLLLSSNFPGLHVELESGEEQNFPLIRSSNSPETHRTRLHLSFILVGESIRLIRGVFS